MNQAQRQVASLGQRQPGGTGGMSTVSIHGLISSTGVPSHASQASIPTIPRRRVQRRDENRSQGNGVGPNRAAKGEGAPTLGSVWRGTCTAKSRSPRSTQYSSCIAWPTDKPCQGAGIASAQNDLIGRLWAPPPAPHQGSWAPCPLPQGVRKMADEREPRLYPVAPGRRESRISPGASQPSASRSARHGPSRLRTMCLGARR
jgi:hypothetical protein